jgi:hypothetical protein
MTAEEGKLYVNGHEQAVIRMAQEWSGQGSSYRQIAPDLNVAGVAISREGETSTKKILLAAI